ncbi:hypothetical protein [Emticicia sp. 17c]|uniref:hypothetical protein n=1 Tax=Emticicia sp. 17c TaxID=3127704 RepID=UPI00301C6777
MTNEKIVFLKGKLYEAGGKKTTNVHIEDGENEYKIECSQEEARELKDFLYRPIFLSTIKVTKSNYPPEYKLIDYYNSQEEQNKYEDFVQKIVENDTLEKYDLLHDKIYEFIDEDKINDISKLIKVFNNNCTDRGVLRTILISLKPIIHNETYKQLNSSYQSLSELLRAGSSKKKI